MAFSAAEDLSPHLLTVPQDLLAYRDVLGLLEVGLAGCAMQHCMFASRYRPWIQPEQTTAHGCHTSAGLYSCSALAESAEA